MMNFKHPFKADDEDESPDYFDGPDVPDKPVEPKKPKLTPDNPDYWDEDESEFAHILPHHPKRHLTWIWLGAAVLGVALIIGFWLRFLNPYVTEATQSGYLEGIEYRGMLFKTYEGVLLPYKELHDTTRIYRRDFTFSVKDKEVANELKRYLGTGRPVKVTYERYRATLPWRGASKIIVTAADSVDPRTLLPPDVAPEMTERPADVSADAKAVEGPSQR